MGTCKTFKEMGLKRLFLSVWSFDGAPVSDMQVHLIGDSKLTVYVNMSLNGLC